MASALIRGVMVGNSNRQQGQSDPAAPRESVAVAIAKYEQGDDSELSTIVLPPNSYSPANSLATRISRLPLRAQPAGMTGVINQIRLSSDGTTAAPAPWGVLVVEQR